MTAAQCGHVLIMSELLKHGSEVNARFQPIGWTALMLAVLNNQLEAAELLLHHGADAKLQDVNDKDAAQLARALGHNRMASLLSGKERRVLITSACLQVGRVLRVKA